MAQATTIDDLTADAIRRAIASATAGRLSEACGIAQSALEEGGEPAALNALLGMLWGRRGDAERSVQHLRLAHDARPDDLVIATNLASALAQLGRYEEGLSVATEERARSDKSLSLMKLRGFLAQMTDDYRLAIACYEQAVAAVPNDWESWNNLGNARRLEGDFDGSVSALARGVELNPHSAPVRLNYATSLLSAGKFEDAERELERMAQEFPADAKPLRELHALFKAQSREQDALRAIESAISRDPNNLDQRLALASHQLSMLRHSDAEDTYRDVVRRDPSNELGNLGLAVVFELTNRGEALSALVEEAADRGVSDQVLNFIRAFDHRRAKRFEEGLAALRDVPEDIDNARRAHLLGQLEEGAGHYDEAFRAFERMNEIQRDDPSEPEQRATAYRNIVRAHSDALGAQILKSWREVPVDDRPSPVFLVGFPRSGTTLLDTILMSHPRVEVLEEEPALKKANEAILDLSELATASAAVVQRARDTYFEVAGRLTPLAPGNLLVDKNPMSMNSIPFIRRIFPDARIILALRHPCDVVLSCFSTNFKLNDAMASFVRLETTVELYDLSFGYFEQARALLKPEVHTIYYERIIEDRYNELRPLFDFLRLDWHDDVLEHQTTARGRGYIKTASYAQVVEPIYKRSAGRWQNYRKHLEPVIPLLRPWAQKFGYEI
jgi:tetratricopeptide (TPR) repeat protein